MNDEIEQQMSVLEQKLKGLIDSQRCFLLALQEIMMFPHDFSDPVALCERAWNECWEVNDLLAQTLAVVPSTVKELRSRVVETVELNRMMEL